MKKAIYQLIQMFAASTFIGISVYGIMIFWGGIINVEIPAAISLLLGLGAVVCVVIIVVMGDVLDRIMEQEGKDDSP